MKKLLTPLIATLAFAAHASEETDWLELNEGFEGKKIGAKVTTITTAKDNNEQIVTVAIPKTSIQKTDDIEEVIVIGKQPRQKLELPKLNIHYEWANDFENDYYGLIIRFNDQQKYPIRIFLMNDESNELSPSSPK